MGGGGRHRLSPRVGRRRHERADVRLVLGGLDHVGRQPVGPVQRSVLARGESGEAPRWAAQAGVVAAPARDVPLECPPKRLNGAGVRGRDRPAGVWREAQCQRERPARRHLDPGSLHDIPVGRRAVAVDETVVGIELAQAVAGAADEPTGLSQERVICQECADDGRRERTLRGLCVRRDERRRSRVDGGVVRTAIGLATAARVVDRRVVSDVDLEVPDRACVAVRRHQPRMDDDAVTRRVGDVVADQPEVVSAVGARHPADHAAAIRRADHIGHVPLLQRGERSSVGHDVLDGAHVGVLDRRAEHVRQHAIGDREPNRRPGIARRPEAVLAGRVQIGGGARATWSRACGSGGVR